VPKSFARLGNVPTRYRPAWGALLSECLPAAMRTPAGSVARFEPPLGRVRGRIDAEAAAYPSTVMMILPICSLLSMWKGCGRAGFKIIADRYRNRRRRFGLRFFLIAAIYDMELQAL
jgi:hypothetical protein